MQQKQNNIVLKLVFFAVILMICSFGLFKINFVSASGQNRNAEGLSNEAAAKAGSNANHIEKAGRPALPVWESYTAGQRQIYIRNFGEASEAVPASNRENPKESVKKDSANPAGIQQYSESRVARVQWVFDKKTKNWMLKTVKAEPRHTNPVRARLDLIAAGKLAYDENSVMEVGKKFAGFQSKQQCKGYAKNVFYLCFKVMPGKTVNKPNNHQLKPEQGIRMLAEDSNVQSAADAQNLFRKAKTGDFVQMRRFHGGPHSAIVYRVERDGVTFMEANTDFHNTITKTKHTWKSLDQKNAKMTIYTADDYNLK